MVGDRETSSAGQVAGVPGTAQMVAPPAVEVQNLCKEFSVPDGQGPFSRRTLVAVNDVSFAVAKGTALGIVGESGSGKTTVSRILMGLETATSGDVSIFGVPRAITRRGNARARRDRARQLQMVFQNPYRSLDPLQTAGSSVAEVLELHFSLSAANRAARVQELFDLVRLEPRHAKALPSELSGGQRQRVSIARALASQPEILILDEAVAALDVSVQAQVLNVLADVREETGVTLLFVSHDLAVIRQISDEVIVMQAGDIVESGLTSDVLDNPQHPYTRVLRDSVPRPGWKPGFARRR